MPTISVDNVAMSAKTAVITGAGSGVGQASAVLMTQEGWNIVILGRRASALQETANLVAQACNNMTPPVCLPIPCDIGDETQVKTMAQHVLATFSSVDAVINSAGTNTPKRSLAEIGQDDYKMMIDANLNGAYYCTQAFLPIMRKQGHGTIVNIGSIAGLQGSALAGVAYVMAKFGTRGLTQAINAEERKYGIRACHVAPGDINTPLLEKRPAPPPLELRGKMLTGEDVARCALLAINMPANAVIEEIVIRPS
jgi:NAD(P)-dependent dehydrogenase (short-subunit alcohol dehydrogenase family)